MQVYSTTNLMAEKHPHKKCLEHHKYTLPEEADRTLKTEIQLRAF